MAIKILPSEYAIDRPHARGVVASGFIFLSGVGGTDPATGTVPPTMAEQAEIICKRIKASLEVAESSVENIVKIVTYVTDINSYRDDCAPIIRKFFPPRAATLVGVKQLARQGVMIEVDVTAVVDKS